LGSLSDRIGRQKVIILGWLAYAIAYLGFGLANSTLAIWLLFAFYGIYYATTEGVAKAYIADVTVPEHRGKAYGIYNSLIGLVTLPASIIAGFMWDKINPSAPFLFGSIIAIISVVLLFIYTRIYK
jgi:MFS family permease